LLRNYETTFIIDAHLPGDQIEASIVKYSQFVETHGGQVVSVDRWGKRRLAYEISKKQYGYYVCMRFGAEGDFIKSFEREFKLDEEVLRYLTTIIPSIVIKEEAYQVQKKKRLAEAEEAAKAEEAASTVEPVVETAPEPEVEAPAEEKPEEEAQA